ncbi:hypothetical protein CK934_20805 [Chitinophaga sp. MD30]|nr:hypothetical protein CK934_20805 [Chitinophaga sp. MD30]
MLFPGTEMHLITFFFVVIEMVMFLYQMIYYLSRPRDKSRLWYLILLVLLLGYNITGGLFPDPAIPIPIVVQNIIAYGTGFTMASFFPYYFYKAFNLKRLRFHALYGIFLFLILPFFLFFVIGYSINKDLGWTRRYGVIIPFLYSISLVWALTKAVLIKYREDKSKAELKEIFAVYLAVIPWASMTLLSYFNASQALEVSITNGGFLVITVLFIRRTVRESRQEYDELQELNSTLTEKVKERTRKLEELNEQKTHTFVNLAHETKTPLTLISNYLEEYIDKYGETTELTVIRKNIDKLTKDISNFFDLERYSKGFDVYNHDQVTDFSELLNDNLVLFRHYASHRQVSISSDITPDLHVKADPDAINRIVNNLVENAIRYSRENSRIHVSLRVGEEDLLHFSVQDEGMGIPRNMQQKIFEPYFQIYTAKKSSQGMGLGLPIVRQIVDGLAGKITVESNPDKKTGTTMKVSLPIYQAGINEEAAIYAVHQHTRLYPETFQVEDSPFDEQHQTLMIVEDNLAMLQYLTRKLSTQYNIIVALNGQEALKKIREATILPHLIISDVMMDKVDGYKFASILSEDARYNHIPFIFLSAKYTSDDRLQGLQLGAIDFIRKPFRIPELSQKIASILENAERQRKVLLNSAFSALKNLGQIPPPPSTPVDPVPENVPAPAARVGSRFEQNCQRYHLTSREIDIARLICEGHKYKDIGTTLFISEKTVTKHVQNIFEKVAIRNKVQLINKLEAGDD